MIGKTNLGGSGGGLNFKVVGGTNAPSGHENLVWVNTSTPITSWVVSPNQPVAPIAGMVWIKDGNANGINIIKKNVVEVFPSGAQQYVDGEWKSLDAYIRHGVEWVQFGWARSVAGLRQDLRKTNYARLSTDIGDKMTLTNESRYFRRTSDAPIAIFCLARDSASGTYSGYGAISTKDNLIGTNNPNGGIAKINTALTTPKGTRFFAWTMGAKWGIDSAKVKFETGYDTMEILVKNGDVMLLNNGSFSASSQEKLAEMYSYIDYLAELEA